MSTTATAITLPANSITRADAEGVLERLTDEYDRRAVQEYLDETEGTQADDPHALTRMAIRGRGVVIETMLTLARRAMGR